MTLARRINCRDLNQVSKQPASWSVFVYVCNQIQPSRISDLCFGFRPIKGKHKTSLPELTGNVTNSLSNYHHSRRTLCISCQHNSKGFSYFWANTCSLFYVLFKCRIVNYASCGDFCVLLLDFAPPQIYFIRSGKKQWYWRF